MPPIFPIIKKVTVIEEVIGGSGPNPVDAFSLGIKFSESVSAPGDALQVAFAFPESVPGPTDALRLGFAFPESTPTPTDALALRVIVPESVPGPTDGVSLAIAFADSVPAQTETVKLGLTYPDTVAAAADALLRLGLGIAETIGVQNDVATFLIALTLGDNVSAPTDALTLLRLTGLGDTVGTPTDTRKATATWRQGATTAASTGANPWTNPANAQGLNNATLATSADTSAIAAWASALRLDPYPDPDPNFSTWTIVSVKLYEYAKYAPGTLPAAGSWQLQYRLAAGAYSSAESINTAFDSKAAPKVFDITATKPGGGAWSWTDIGNLNTNVIYNSALAETSSAEVDAVVVEVVATKDPL